MRKKKVTMLDIATEVGVSQPTVSVILNGSGSVKVSEETKQRVFAKARELGYQFKSVRHGYRHSRIALVVNSLNMHDPFISAISSAKARAWERDAVLSVFDYEDNDDLKMAMFDEIRTGDYQGLIFASNTPREIDSSEVLTLEKRVLLNCYDSGSDKIPALLPADSLGGFRACEHLINAGYRKIAMVCGESWSLSSIDREKGFRQAMANHGLPVNDHSIVYGNWSVKQAFLATQSLLALPSLPDAIFCASDLMVLGVYQALQQRGLRVPQDIAVIGYDNQLLATEISPSLSSVELPYDEMGRMAVDQILDDTSPEFPVIKVEGELYERESSRALVTS
ncbi:LacI family DNA-binding transcriptional regulator [Reinekea sp. G2M2-21]|uniref:LacI family DNA-binding transcriptional regulator n=1 Tax=Reinekea sp. G2M2-21 TaxID=2788942 RepID=UPI001E42E12E|nr:LacI family DNA-binding transcriptional regulator [Reinekea sp. G2M2-21]